jgi:hypothetical protein
MQTFQEFDRGVNSALFVAVHPCKEPHSQVTSPFSWTGEKIAREALRNIERIPIGEVRRKQVVGSPRQFIERM